ncbi:MAG: GGDEF domain-containing protein [Burkholderiales bacterium]|nr:GGDEF domain-containing protein [Burkholderiales bacterium]
MPEFTNPSEIARETLKALSTRRIAPTPDNYQTIYNEIAGLPSESGNLEVEKILERVLKDSPPASPEIAKAADLLRKALAEKDEGSMETALSILFKAKPLPWGSLIRDFLKVWEQKHSGWTMARKREGLDTVLNNFGSNPEALYPKLQSLFKSWSASPALQSELVDDTAEKIAVPGGNNVDIAGALRELLAQTYSTGFMALLQHSPELAEEAHLLSRKAKEAADAKALAALTSKLKHFWFKLEIRAGDNAEIQEGLLRLLGLVAENIHDIVVDDKYLQGQMDVVRNIIASPLKRSVLDDAERSLKAVVYKQSAVKQSVNEAKSSLKFLIANFIERLGEFSESTGEYHSKIDLYSQKLSQSDDIAQITSILDDVLRDTKSIQIDTLRSRDSVLDSQGRVNAANQRIIELESELENLSEMVREDQLTRTLNRRGMEEAFEREVSRSERRKTPLCIAILDIDDFKKLNDSLGHQAGDDALVHLSRTIKETTRPNDVVSRFGGEEFLIILPDSELEDAVLAITRLQRELTKQIFMYNNQKQVITFSAGVALKQPHESRDTLIGRADKAMYEAKKAGKNRVFSAPVERPA